jgi:hypothetical protein
MALARRAALQQQQVIVAARLAQLGLGQSLRGADEIDERDVSEGNLALVGVADVDVDQAVGDAVEAAGDALAAAEQGGDAFVSGSLGGEPQRGRERERGRDGDALRQAEAPDET